MNTQHTPTPWTAEPGASHYEIHCERGAESVPHATQVANVLMLGERREACRANAAFIVRACNAHDELVAALLRIYRADASGNNGAYMGEASLCPAFASHAERALKLAGAI
jgi:hypothetical protein